MYEGKKKKGKGSFMCFFGLEDEQHSNIMVRLPKYSPYLLKTATTLYRIVIMCTMFSQNTSSPNPSSNNCSTLKKNTMLEKDLYFQEYIYIYIYLCKLGQRNRRRRVINLFTKN